MGLPSLVGIASIPYLIRHIGIEAFGILTLIWALIGYFSLFDFGLGRALTQQIASRKGTNQQWEIPMLAKSGLVFTGCTGSAGGLLLALLAHRLANDWLNVSAGLAPDTATSLLVAALGIPPTTFTTGLRGISEAYEDFKAINLIRILMGVATFGLPVASVMLFGPSLPLIVAALVVARLAALAGQWWLVNESLPSGWLRCQAQARYVKGLISLSVWMTISNIIGPLVLTIDRFLIAAIIAAGVVAFYTVPSETIIRLLMLPAALTGALFPRLASYWQEDRGGAKDLYFRCLKLVAMVMGPLCLVIALGSYWGLSLWLSSEFASQSWLIASILSVGIFLNSIAFVPFATIQAVGKAKATALINIGVLIVYVPILLLFLTWFGIIGAAIAWVLRALLDVLLLLVAAKKTLERS